MTFSKWPAAWCSPPSTFSYLLLVYPFPVSSIQSILSSTWPCLVSPNLLSLFCVQDRSANLEDDKPQITGEVTIGLNSIVESKHFLGISDCWVCNKFSMEKLGSIKTDRNRERGPRQKGFSLNFHWVVWQNVVLFSFVGGTVAHLEKELNKINCCPWWCNFYSIPKAFGFCVLYENF